MLRCRDPIATLLSFALATLIAGEVVLKLDAHVYTHHPARTSICLPSMVLQTARALAAAPNRAA
jgi:hypothetical protein